MKFSQNYRQLSAIYFYCFTHFVEQFLADFLLLFLLCRRNILAKGILPRFLAHAHNCVDSERLFSLKRVFEQFAHIASGFATTRLVPFALSRIMRASDPAHVPAYPLSSERLHLLCENAPNLSSFQSSKSAIDHYILSKRLPYVVFWRLGVLAARRFVGARR